MDLAGLAGGRRLLGSQHYCGPPGGVNRAKERQTCVKPLDVASLWIDALAGRTSARRLRPSIGDDARGRPALNCKDTRTAFAALLDGDLALTERAPVEVHLDQCIACWAKLEHLRSQPAPFRMLWRLRVAFSSVESFLDEAARLHRPAFLRVPSRMIPMTAA